MNRCLTRLVVLSFVVLTTACAAGEATTRPPPSAPVASTPPAPALSQSELNQLMGAPGSDRGRSSGAHVLGRDGNAPSRDGSPSASVDGSSPSAPAQPGQPGQSPQFAPSAGEPRGMFAKDARDTALKSAFGVNGSGHARGHYVQPGLEPRVQPGGRLPTTYAPAVDYGFSQKK